MADDTYVPEADDDSADLSQRAKWALVAAVLLCLVGAPLAILFWPPTFVPYQDAYLGLALVPGLILGAVGAWTATR